MDTLEQMVQKYLITSAEIGAIANIPQLNAYDNYARETGAKIIIIPILGQNSGKEDAVLDERLAEYELATDKKITKKLHIENFGIKAQNINPLTGLRRFSSLDGSTIIGSPKQHLEFVANSNKYDPRALISTGVCTIPNYRESFRIGKIGKKDHKQGCVLVDVENNGSYHFRQVQNISDGSFISLGRKYLAKGKSKQVGADTLVLGDLHVANLDLNAYQASLQMIDDLKPKYVVLHDVFDGQSITHHDKGMIINRGKKAISGHLSLYDELRRTGEVLDEIYSHGPKDMKVVVVKSNHDETLDKYLNDVRFVGDAQNLELSVRLANSMLSGKDPLREGIEMTYGKLPRNGVTFLDRDDEFARYGWQLGFHGDKGPSGSRGSPTSFEYSLGKAIVAHAHSPCIRKDVFRVGTLERMDVDYTKGSTGSWSFTNAVIYNNHKAELLNIFKNRYKA